MRKTWSTKYGDAIREMVVQEYLTTNLGYRELGKKYDINYATIAYWVKVARRNAEKENEHGISNAEKS